MTLCALFSQAQLVINEYQSNNDSTLFFNGETPDWIEIYNTTDETVALTGWMLSDELNEPGKFVFSSSLIPPNGFQLIYATGNDENLLENEAGFALSDGFDTVYLFSPDSQLVDFLFASCVPDDHSYGRLLAQNETGWYNVPTPNQPNTTDTVTITRYDDFITASTASGFFTSPIEVELAVGDPRTIVYFSDDGDEADPSETIYESPLRLLNKRNQKDKFADEPTSPLWKEPKSKVFKAQVIRARGYFEGCPVTDELFRTYVIDENTDRKYRTTLFSLIVEGDDFFSDDEGIYVPGDNFDPSQEGSTGNYFQKGGAWEREVHIEAFEADRSPMIKQNGRIRINGNTSRSYPQKSLRLYAENRENPAAVFSYPFFPDRTFTDYETLILRTAGADISNTFFKDVICHELAKSLVVDYQSFRQTVVLVNGEYWGIHNLRERQDEFYIERLYNMPQGTYDLISLSDFNVGRVEEVEGDREAFDAMMRYVRTHDLSDDAQMDTMYQLIDIPNFIDYHVLQLFVANEDWLNSNTKLWRERSEAGKWRWLFFDCDRCFSDLDNQRLSNLMGNVIESSWADWATELQRAMLTNEGFRKQFHARFIWAMEHVFTTRNLLRIINQFEDQYEPLALEHIYRWRIPETYYAWNDNVAALKTFAVYRPLEMMDQLERNFGNPYMIFPNPATQQVRIAKVDQSPGIAQLAIYNSQGEIVHLDDYYYLNTVIATENYPAGYYVARITTGELVFALPLVVLR